MKRYRYWFNYRGPSLVADGDGSVEVEDGLDAGGVHDMAKAKVAEGFSGPLESVVITRLTLVPDRATTMGS